MREGMRDRRRLQRILLGQHPPDAARLRGRVVDDADASLRNLTAESDRAFHREQPLRRERDDAQHAGVSLAGVAFGAEAARTRHVRSFAPHGE